MSRGEIIRPNWPLYLSLKKLGFERIVGVDEVGRGALAGPIVVAAVEIDELIEGVTDSKLITRPRRATYDTNIRELAKQLSIGVATNEEIDSLGINEAQKLAYGRALEKISTDLVLTDFVHLDTHKYLTSVKGDQLFYPVSAASIVAKVYRDNLMYELHQQFPTYDWQNNVGYGTKKHLDAIKKNGLCSWHRRSFGLDKR